MPFSKTTLTVREIIDGNYMLPMENCVHLESPEFPVYVADVCVGSVTARLGRSVTGDLFVACACDFTIGSSPYLDYTFDEQWDDEWRERAYCLFTAVTAYTGDNLAFQTWEELRVAYSGGSQFFIDNGFAEC